MIKKAEQILEKLSLKSTHGNVRGSLKSSLNRTLSELWNNKINFEHLIFKYPFIEEIDVYKTSSGKGAVVVKYADNYRFE